MRSLWIMIVALVLAAGCWGTKKGTRGTNVDPTGDGPDGPGPWSPGGGGTSAATDRP